jgi:hypothetical protein
MIAFSDAELRDLFTLSMKTDGCQTRTFLMISHELADRGR